MRSPLTVCAACFLRKVRAGLMIDRWRVCRWHGQMTSAARLTASRIIGGPITWQGLLGRWTCLVFSLWGSTAGPLAVWFRSIPGILHELLGDSRILRPSAEANSKVRLVDLRRGLKGYSHLSGKQEARAVGLPTLTLQTIARIASRLLHKAAAFVGRWETGLVKGERPKQPGRHNEIRIHHETC